MNDRDPGRSSRFDRVGRLSRQAPVARRVERRERAAPDSGLRFVPGQPRNPELISFLQRSVGNQATQKGLQLQRDLSVSRWPIPGPLPPWQGRSAPSGSLSPQDRQSLEYATLTEIGTAFTGFTDACTANITAMKAAAKADAEFAALAIDIATGFLAPVWANYVVGKLLAKAESKVVDEVSKKTVATLISDSDVIKASFTAATKIGGYDLKKNAVPLFGEYADDKLLDKLKIEFQKNAVSMSGNLPKMSNDELLATWVAFDPDFANVETYKGAIKTLLDEFHGVEDLGVHKLFGDDVQDQNHLLVKVDGFGYAITYREMETLLYDPSGYRFLEAIDDYLVDAAKRQAKEVGQQHIPTLKASEIENVPKGIKPWGKP
jgi:hypothetical protein